MLQGLAPATKGGSVGDDLKASDKRLGRLVRRFLNKQALSPKE